VNKKWRGQSGRWIALKPSLLQVLIVTEVSSVEPVLIPLLRQDLHRQGLGHCVNIGDKAVDFSPSFKLILATRNPSISLPPSVAPVLTIANFAITESALQSQLLAQTLRHEQPELEEQHRCTLLTATALLLLTLLGENISKAPKGRQDLFIT
jgi:hypothetical protein